MLSSIQFFKPEEEDRIPNRAGVYAFLYNPFERSRLGLYVGDSYSEGRLLEARIALKAKLSRLDKLRSDLILSGDISVKGTYSGDVKVFSGSIPRSQSLELWSDIDSIEDNEFIEYLEMAEKTCLILPPLYCGMTVRQGLKERYLQHKQNYHSAREGTFGGRLSASNLSWADIRLLCIPITTPSETESSVRMLERHLIYLLGPILSVK
ncbi:hypothetical protein [Pseudomonas sp. Gutcm_11s]|uniref:hypothetical protein n=1 Tax=Pseudomonas sp. Gutcm_11s TaxID=3026088 RepID=UPI00235E5C82|nr:hypothetical protein [Pseudomonas sp. Gutcm_11s]MDD0841182.1 hypothetical protein [Pseudomonas sp. Gutcm_11s]